MLLFCNDAVGQVMPDTLDNRRYFPLAVGNEWHMVEFAFASPIATYRRLNIVADTVVNDRRYFKSISERFDKSFFLESLKESWLRYNEVGAVLGFENIEDDTLVPDSTLQWYHADFKDSVDIGLVNGKGFVDGVYDTTITFAGPVSVPVASMKQLYVPDPLRGTSYYVQETYAADFGLISYQYFDGGDGYLAYARINGVEFGTRAIFVSNETESVPENTLRMTTAYPNPAQGSVTIGYVSRKGELVKIEVYDLLGRKILDLSSPAINKEIRIDISNLSPGRYIIRLSDSQGHAVNALITVV